jgi:hypothetical protein
MTCLQSSDEHSFRRWRNGSPQLAVHPQLSGALKQNLATQWLFIISLSKHSLVFAINHQLGIKDKKRSSRHDSKDILIFVCFLMAAAAILANRPIPTSLNYYASTVDGQSPYNFTYSPPPDGLPQSNITSEAIDTVIHDIRGKEDTVSLDKTGFQFVPHVSQEKEFVDEEAIRTRYYDEVVELLKKHTGAKRILIFDHTVRQVSLFPTRCRDANSYSGVLSRKANLGITRSTEVRWYAFVNISVSIRSSLTPLLPSRRACTSIRRIPLPWPVYASILPKTPIVCSKVACASSTSGVLSGTPSRIIPSRSQTGAASIRTMTSSRRGTSTRIGRELRSACVTIRRTSGTT